MNEFRILDHPHILMRPRLIAPYSWAGHIPFAYLAIELLKPRRFVELGTHTGNSYLAVCQAVLANGLATECFAVDTWQGDEHASLYGEDVYEELSSYHDPRYSAFSTLLRKTFDEALSDIDDGSVDLLHIDGLHTYDAVRHDFDTWLPKLSDRAVVLMHDVAVLDRNFGVWKCLEELSTRYRTFSFSHSNGLGVVCVGSQVPEAFAAFLDEADRAGDQVRQFFEAAAATLVDPGTGLPANASSSTSSSLNAQMFYRMQDEVFAEERSVALTRQNVEGQVLLRFELPQDAKLTHVRLDPSDAPGVYGIAEVALVSRSGKHWRLDDFPSRVRSLGGDRLEPLAPALYRFVTLDVDPHIEFDLSDIAVEAASGQIAAVEVSLVCEAVIRDAVSSHLAAEVGSATLQARSRVRDSEHLANLIQASQATLAGAQAELARRVSAYAHDVSSSTSVVVSAIQDASARQEVAEVEARLAVAVLNEKLDGAKASKANEASVAALHELSGAILEALSTQSAQLDHVSQTQRSTEELVHALHKRMDKRTPRYFLRRLFGGR